MKTTAASRRTNRLAGEKSPYLLQHQFNPVDWQPWGEAAFAQARAENKPIFLSIGYSTCHWCHVMERESFESDKVARFLNEHFVSIKVDREERPDVDRIYMLFVQATAHQGGWPLNVFLTPELKAFFGGTYFPPDGRTSEGRPGFLQVLQRIHELWTSRHGEVVDSAVQIHKQLAEAAGEIAPGDQRFTPNTIREAVLLFKRAYDPRHGGFGQAPKFPQPSVPQFLLRGAARFGDDEAQRMVLQTCDHMAAGGIHDQLGGGFARYSVDAEWLVPHFEKMLYDNAQLAQLYLEARVVSGEPRYAEVARAILGYVLRDLTHPDGGFYSAEDADSEGHEGKFYCWTHEELAGLLTKEEFQVAVRYFGLTERGNFTDHSHPHPLPHQNVLSIVDPGLLEAEQTLLAAAKQKMIAARAKRVRPHLDDKVLASWNGLMLGAFARAYAVLGDESYRLAAEKNLAFLQRNLWDDAQSSAGVSPAHPSLAGTGETPVLRCGTLYHRWRDGARDQAQLLHAYAFLLSGVIELYEATIQPRHLEFAVALAEAMLAKFYDGDNGGFWQSAPGGGDLILRLKEDYDGAEPSGNSVAILSLLKLGKITERPDFAEAAEKSLRLFAHRLQETPQAVPYLLQALDFALEQPRRAVVVGDPAQPETRALVHTLHTVFQPKKVVLGTTGPVESFAKTLPTTPSPMIYLCTGAACQPPANDAGTIRKLLG